MTEITKKQLDESKPEPKPRKKPEPKPRKKPKPKPKPVEVKEQELFPPQGPAPHIMMENWIQLPIDERPEKLKFIRHETRVDKFNSAVGRVEITPVVCQICGFNAAAANQVEDYYKASSDFRGTLRGVLEQHVNQAHDPSVKLIVEEDEKPTKWLGEPLSRKKLRTR